MSMPGGSEPATSLEKQTRLFNGAHGQAIVADVVGRGPPVVLAHGGGQTRAAWARTATALMQAGHPAIAIDMRGHGESALHFTGGWRAMTRRRTAPRSRTSSTSCNSKACATNWSMRFRSA
jgi:pimeloyl-ACP methyl ester carboxylesterase